MCRSGCANKEPLLRALPAPIRATLLDAAASTDQALLAAVEAAIREHPGLAEAICARPSAKARARRRDPDGIGRAAFANPDSRIGRHRVRRWRSGYRRSRRPRRGGRRRRRGGAVEARGEAVADRIPSPRLRTPSLRIPNPARVRRNSTRANTVRKRAWRW